MVEARSGTEGLRGNTVPSKDYILKSELIEKTARNPKLFLENASEYAKLMLIGRLRNYVEFKVKAVLQKKLIAFVKKYPEPTRENCEHPNSLILFDIRDKFFANETHPNKIALWEATFKLLIAEYEHDSYYRFRFDWLLEQIAESDWQPRSRNIHVHWKESWRGDEGVFFPEAIQDRINSWRK